MIKQFLKKVFWLILCGLIVLNGVSLYRRCIQKETFPMVAGYGLSIIASGSMEPALSVGDLTIAHQQTDYQVDDIIIFLQEGDQRPTTHRIMQINGAELVTQGDANNVEDQPILRQQVYGKIIFAVPKIGLICQFLQTPLGMLLIIGCLILLLVFRRRR